SPSAFAVLRLITSSYLVGACTGRSAGLAPLRDAIDVTRRASEWIDRVGAVRDQATADDVAAMPVDGGQSMPIRQRDNEVAMNERQCGCRHDQAAILPARECGDGALDLAGIAQVDRSQLHPQRWRHGLDSAELPDPGGDGRIPKPRHPRYARRNLLEHLQPFPAHAIFENHEASRVTARFSQARD